MATEIIKRLKRENVLLKIAVIILLCLLLLLFIQKEGVNYEKLDYLQPESYQWEQSG